MKNRVAIVVAVLVCFMTPLGLRAQSVTGSNPEAVAVNPVTNQIYVANYIDDTVTVINGATNSTTTVPVGAGPVAVAVNPVTNQIYVANFDGDNVTVINGATNSTTTVPVGAGPVAVAVNPVTNQIYVANFDGDNVTVINGATNSTTTVPVGAGPVAVAVNPVTNQIYVVNQNSGNVTVINGATNSTTAVTVGQTPVAVAVNPVTNQIYVANFDGDNVTVINGTTNSTATVAVGLGPDAVAVNPVTNQIYVANNGSNAVNGVRGNTVTVIDGTTNSTTAVTVGQTPRAVAVNPVTNQIYVANYIDDTVTVINGTTNSTTNSTTTVPAGAGPDAVAVNPVTNQIYVANHNSGNVTVISGTTNLTTTVAAGTTAVAVAVNPVTNQIYVANQNSGNVTVIDGATNSTTTVPVGALPNAQCTNCGVIPGSPAEFVQIGMYTNLLLGETVDESFDGNWAAISSPGFGNSPLSSGEVEVLLRGAYFSTSSWTFNNTLTVSDFGITPVANDFFGWSVRFGGNDFLAVTSPGLLHQRVFFYQNTGSTCVPVFGQPNVCPPTTAPWVPFPMYLDTNPDPSDNRAVQLIAGLGTASAPMCSTGSGVARIALQGQGTVAIYDIDVAGGTIYPPAIISQSGNANGDLAFDTDCQTLVVGGNGGSLLVFRASSSSPNPSWAQTQELPAPATQNTASESTFGLSVVTLGSTQRFTRTIDLWADWLVVGYPEGDCPGAPGIPALADSGIVLAYFRNSVSHQYSYFETICSSGQFTNGRFGESVGISNGELLGLLPGTGSSFGAVYSFKFYDSQWQPNLGAVTTTMDALIPTGHPPPTAVSMASLAIRRSSIIYAAPDTTGVNGHPDAGAINIKYDGCGDSIIESFQGQPFEACDSGGVDTASCNSSCTVPVCGDYYTNTAAGEQCDDGVLNGTPGDGCSTTCQLVATTPAPLTITANPASRQYGAADPSFTASYSGFVNGDTSAALAGTLTCAANDTPSSPAGTYAINCSGQTSPNYSITYLTGTLTITPAPLTITANPASRQYGTPDPAFTATYTGFVNGDTPAVLSGALACTGGDTASTPVGAYAINCSGLSSPNYSISNVPGTLAITPAPLSVVANNATRVYGQPNPPFGPSYSGFVNGENASVLAGTLTCSSPATPSSPVAGSPYAISCSGLTSSNYAITYAAGALTVTAAPLTITANSTSKVLNAPLPAFGASYSGFVNGEGPSVLIGSLSCTTTATATSPVGSYPITCSGLTASNYAISWTAGTLKVMYAPAGVCGHVILPPIDPGGTTVGNQGRTVPAKFQVCDANGVSIGTPGVVTSFFLTQIITGTATTSVEDIVDTNNPDTAFRWDGTEWVFNITTQNLAAGSTYVYTIVLNDGSTIVFQFGLR